MSIVIRGHSQGNEVGVTDDFRLLTAAKVSNRAAIVALTKFRTFVVVFDDASAVAGHYVAYLLNTSTTRNLVIDKIRVSAANAATWKLVTATGTATGGTAATPVNTNRSSGIAAEATALADNVGGFTAGTALLGMTRTPANTGGVLDIDDTHILGPQNAVALEYDAGTTGAASSTWRFYYEDIEGA